MAQQVSPLPEGTLDPTLAMVLGEVLRLPLDRQREVGCVVSGFLAFLADEAAAASVEDDFNRG